MSITVDYFFNYPKPIAELREDLQLWIGCALAPYRGDSSELFCRFLGMELTLEEHCFENGDELNFEDFKYELSIRTAMPDAEFRPQQLATMAMLVYALHRRLSVAGMLVYDIQVLLGRYERRDGTDPDRPKLYDLVSSEFVEFPRYFDTLRSRLAAIEAEREARMNEPRAMLPNPWILRATQPFKLKDSPGNP